MHWPWATLTFPGGEMHETEGRWQIQNPAAVPAVCSHLPGANDSI